MPGRPRCDTRRCMLPASYPRRPLRDVWDPAAIGHDRVGRPGDADHRQRPAPAVGVISARDLEDHAGEEVDVGDLARTRAPPLGVGVGVGDDHAGSSRCLVPAARTLELRAGSVQAVQREHHWRSHPRRGRRVVYAIGAMLAIDGQVMHAEGGLTSIGVRRPCRGTSAWSRRDHGARDCERGGKGNAGSDLSRSVPPVRTVCPQNPGRASLLPSPGQHLGIQRSRAGRVGIIAAVSMARQGRPASG
jgi:hypothetical protein